MTGLRIQTLTEEYMTTMKMKKPAAHTRTGFRKDRDIETDVVCASCHRVRNAEGKWIYTEDQDILNSDATIRHGLCSDCATDIYRKLYAMRLNRYREVVLSMLG